jgi:hypothetical protein
VDCLKLLPLGIDERNPTIQSEEYEDKRSSQLIIDTEQLSIPSSYRHQFVSEGQRDERFGFHQTQTLLRLKKRKLDLSHKQQQVGCSVLRFKVFFGL